MITQEQRERARIILRANPDIAGLKEGEFRIIEETEHAYWTQAVEEAKR